MRRVDADLDVQAVMTQQDRGERVTFFSVAREARGVRESGRVSTGELADEPPAVVVPFEAKGEHEQAVRAHLLETHGLVDAVYQDDLSAQRLAAAVDLPGLGDRHRRNWR